MCLRETWRGPCRGPSSDTWGVLQLLLSQGPQRGSETGSDFFSSKLITTGRVGELGFIVMSTSKSREWDAGIFPCVSLLCSCSETCEGSSFSSLLSA